MLLEERERARVRGFIVNKFRGDPDLFDDGVKILEARSGVRVVGVVPFILDLLIADEDSVALDETKDERRKTDDVRPSSREAVLRQKLDIVVIRLPHISNFDDFDPLRAEADVAVRFVDRAGDLTQPDLIILPGTKTTVADLKFLRERGLAPRFVELARAGVPTLGICGGYQMLGTMIHDPNRVESDETRVDGLGLLPVVTTFAAEKQTMRARGRVVANQGLFKDARDLEIAGYEIHMGRTQLPNGAVPMLRVTARGEDAADDFDGVIAADGWIAGTYFHGLFDDNALRRTLLANLAARRGLARVAAGTPFDRAAMYDRLAAMVRAHLDMDAIYQIIDE
jgi:adenosylcobyric acid synthase